MAWSDAAREAARLARRRKGLKMKELRRGFGRVNQDLFGARVNLENFSNPEWVKKGGWGDEATRNIRDYKSIIENHRRLKAELTRRALARTPAQKDATYARKQRKAGKASIFGGMVVRKLLKGFEY